MHCLPSPTVFFRHYTYIILPSSDYRHHCSRPSFFYGQSSSTSCTLTIIRLRFFSYRTCVYQIFDMNLRDDRIQWECDNGGQQWNQTVIDEGMTFTNETVTGTLLPDKFCDIGVHRTYITFVFCLLVDFILICYAWFLDWRMLARIRHAYALIRRDSCKSERHIPVRQMF